jgi:hypothetical protein
MNTKPCGQCIHYHPLEKGTKGGERRPLSYGYCLKKSVFASNKPGDPVYPPKAVVAELPNAVHALKVVKVNQVEKHCSDYLTRS